MVWFLPLTIRVTLTNITGDTSDANDIGSVQQRVEGPSTWVSGNSANTRYLVAGDEDFDAITDEIMSENPEFNNVDLTGVFVPGLSDPSVGSGEARPEFHDDPTSEALTAPSLGHSNALAAFVGRFSEQAPNQSLPKGRGVRSSAGNLYPQSTIQYLSNNRSAGSHPSNLTGTTHIHNNAGIDATRASSQGPPIPSSRRQPQATSSSLGKSSQRPANPRPSSPTRTSSNGNNASPVTTQSSATAPPRSITVHQPTPPAPNNGQPSRTTAVQVSDEPYSCCGGLHNGIPVLPFEEDHVFKFFQPVYGPVNLGKTRKPRTSKPKAGRKIKREHDEDEVDGAGPSAPNKKTKGER
jgi:hypothetical protein